MLSSIKEILTNFSYLFSKEKNAYSFASVNNINYLLSYLALHYFGNYTNIITC